ncbi:MAG: CYTH domain-containing protein [Bacteroidales bacterium]|nr:CYTH domain-containing protein [Bacteroidales bacterium]
MAKEIERKFLVDGDFRPWVKESVHIVQGYLNSSPERTVRIRTKGDKGYITVKGMTGKGGMSRYEWEKEIGIADAQELLLLCEPGAIDKQRHIIEAGKHIYEVDEFFGENSGLTVAEIELSCEEEDFEKPTWLGKEVTADARYYNSSLMKCPFSKWDK